MKYRTTDVFAPHTVSGKGGKTFTKKRRKAVRGNAQPQDQ